MAFLFLILLCPLQGPCASSFYFAPNLIGNLNGDIINIYPVTEIFNLTHQVDLNMLFLCILKRKIVQSIRCFTITTF